MITLLAFDGALGIRSLNRAIDTLSVPVVPEIGLNPLVLAFTAVVTLVAGVLIGLAPALDAGYPRPSQRWSRTTTS